MTANLDTKALRNALRRRQLAIDTAMTDINAPEKQIEAEAEILNAAPALLDLAERAQEQAKECASNLRSLRASQEECYSLYELYEERDALKAEVERLQIEKQNLVNVVARLSASEREAERLRDALGEMLGIVRCDPAMDGSERPRGLHHNAAEVLARCRPIYFERAALRGEEAPRE
jgi:hypothetical protein